MMFDAIHFTYYWVPCAYTFPEMARLVAQLGLQSAVGRPVDVCPPGTPITGGGGGGSGTLSDGGGQHRLGQPGGSHISLGQDTEQTQSAYTAALKLSGKGDHAGKVKTKAAAAAALNDHAGKGIKAKAASGAKSKHK